MSLAGGAYLQLLQEPAVRRGSKVQQLAGIQSQLQGNPRVSRVTVPIKQGKNGEEQIASISKMFGKVDLSISSYDTAWLAMVPSQDSETKPLFPQCLDWVMEHQHPDGSWCVDPRHPLLLKDSLSSTLACVLALNKWKVGDQLVLRGLDFIQKNYWAAVDKRQHSPIGFEILFPGMMEQATESGLNLPLDSCLSKALLQNQDHEIQRYNLDGKKEQLAYLLEGLGPKFDWTEAMKRQRGNGSLFNSPSTTAAALIHKHDDKCYNYLSSLLKEYDNSVPTIYPLNIYVNLCLIDNLQKLGIDRFFRTEIEVALDKIYRCWVQRDEEILSDVNCRALGFRLLRLHGYDVSSDDLAQFRDQKHFFNSVSAQHKTMNAILELYKTSHTAIYQEEPILDDIKAWTSSFLKQELSNKRIPDRRTHEEVLQALQHSHDTFDRLQSRRNIELLDENLQLLKASYRCSNINNKDLLELSVRDYNVCQAIYRQELKDLKSWLKDSRLDQLKFGRQKLSYSHLASVAMVPDPELTEARIAMTKNSYLSTVSDDLFDYAGSMEELENMISLFERWGQNASSDYCSEQVEILFSAYEGMVKELGFWAFKWQGRDVSRHLAQISHDLLASFMQEAKWTKENVRPTLEEYMENGYVSIALGPSILIPLYFLGPKLSEEMVNSKEYHNLFKHVSIAGRLLNDLASVEREFAQGKMNSVSLRMVDGRGSITKEEAVEEMRGLVEANWRETARMVLQNDGSLLPRACKDLFLGMGRILYYFYKDKDGYSCPLHKAVDEKAIFWDPVIPFLHVAPLGLDK